MTDNAWDLNLKDLDVHNDRHVAWWWVEGGSEGESGMVWEPLYNKRHRWEAVKLMAIIERTVEMNSEQAVKEDLVYYDDFRIQPEYLPARLERRRRPSQGDAEGVEEDDATPEVEVVASGASKSAKGRKRAERKAAARAKIKEALSQ